MLSVHLQQMVAGSNGPASCVEDLSEHLYHAQVHLMRSTTECEDISTTEVFSGHVPFIQLNSADCKRKAGDLFVD